MLPQYNTEILIANIKRRCAVPTSQLTYTDEDFVLLATDALLDEITPLMMSTRNEFFVDYVDVQVNAERKIEFPGGAIGSHLRSVCYFQNTSPLTLINLPRIDIDVVAGVGIPRYLNIAGFYIQGNYMYIYPATSVPVNTTVRIYYFRRCLTLASPSNYGRIVTINTMSNEIVVDFTPATFEVGVTLNTINSAPNFNVTNEAAEITAISAPTITLDTVEGMQVGDYVTVEGYSAIPQIPIEAMGYLSQLTAAKALEGLGDQAGMKAALDKAMALKQDLMVMLSNRIDGSPKKIVNPSGGMRVGSSMYRRGWSNW